MKCIEKYKKRTQRKGSTIAERIVNEGKYFFDKHSTESPTASRVKVTLPYEEYTITDETRELDCFITNVSLNDSKTLDEKYIHFSCGANVDVGCYVKWQGWTWVISFREHNTVDTHQTFTMRKCNNTFRYKINDIVYEVPVSITNLTLYSDGLAEGVYLSRQDAKRNMLLGNNFVTELIGAGTRVMLTKKTVFKVTHIDDFSHKGLVEWIIYQTQIIAEDDLDNNIAHNPDTIEPPEVDFIEATIVGSDTIQLSGDEEYILGGVDVLEVYWNIISKGDKAKIEHSTNNSCSIYIDTTDSRYIGNTVVLTAYTTSIVEEEIDGEIVETVVEEVIKEKEIKVIGFF